MSQTCELQNGQTAELLSLSSASTLATHHAAHKPVRATVRSATMDRMAALTTNPVSRFSQVPSFGIAFIASIVVLFTFAAWAFFDASFPAILNSSWVVEWDELWPRILLFCVLGLAGGITALIVVYRLFFGHPQGRSIRALLFAVLLTAFWLTLFISREQIAEAGFHWRVLRMLPGMKADASILLDKWPTENGSLPFLGDFAVDAKSAELVPIRFIKPDTVF